MTFAPRVSEEIVIAGATWRLPPHPSAPHAPWSRKGSTSFVYRLDGSGESRALKVLEPVWRGPDNAERASKLKHLATLKGLRTAARTVLTPDTVTGAPALVGALLMPWVEGYNWSDVVRARTALTQEQSLHLARDLAAVLEGLEQRNVAHCNLSGNSVMIATGPIPTVELVDLEHVFAIGQPPPQPPSAGTPSRVRASGDRPLWEAQADRFAGAVMLAEMLGWCDEAVRAAAAEESFFAGEDMLVGQAPERYRILLERLRATWGERLGRMFEHAWLSPTPVAGPAFRDWLAALPERVGMPVGPSTARPTGVPSLGAAASAPPPAAQPWTPPTAAPAAAAWQPSPPPITPHTPPPARPRVPLLAVIVVLAAIIGGGVWFLATRRAGPPPVPGLEKVDIPSPTFSSSAAPARPSASASTTASSAPSTSPSGTASPSAGPAPSTAASGAPAASPAASGAPTASPAASGAPAASPAASGAPAASGVPEASGTPAARPSSAPSARPEASGAPATVGGRIVDATMCRSVDDAGKPVDRVTAYDPFATFVCAFRVPDGRKGTVVTARWQDPQGFSRTTTATISRDGESYLYVKLQPTPAFTMGSYTVALELAGKVEQEVRFKVSATGR